MRCQFAPVLTLVLVATRASTSFADITLNSLFGDGMVLQRDVECPMWGTAKPNVDVTASIAGKIVATADSRLDGSFRLTLPKLAEPGPYEIVVKAGDETTTLHDVLAGDVWLCGGQSNMQWTVNDSVNGPAEVAAATLPNVRLFYVPRVASPAPLKSIDAHWTPCTPETVRDFSAVAYFFGRDLNQKLTVPIGLIHSSWGGTPAESWTPLESLRALNDLPGAQRLVARGDRDSTSATLDAFIAATQHYIEATGHADPGMTDESKAWTAREFDDAAWPTMPVPGDVNKQPNVKEGSVVWLRRHVDVPADADGKPALLELSLVDDFDQTFVNGTPVGATNFHSPDWTSKPRRYALPAGVLRAGDNVVAVRVVDLGGGAGLTGNANQIRLTLPAASGQVPMSLPLAGRWRYAVERAGPTISPVAADRPTLPPAGLLRPDNPQFPGSLYNAMIAPLGDDAIKGVIWYQGESNADRAAEYPKLLATMINDWREQLKQVDVPFYIVGLANYRAAATRPVQASEWGALREAQREIAHEVNHVATTVTIDVGDAGNIHPKDKQTVGQRLANVALAETYGDASAPRSPTLREATRGAGGQVIVAFDNVGSGLVVRGETLSSFTLAGEDGVFHDADARIDGDRVIVSSADVARPTIVRYAYADNPTASLFNKEQQPAEPFECKVK